MSDTSKEPVAAKEEQMKEMDEIEPLRVGDKGMVLVTWREGENSKLEATVVERRPSDFWERRNKKRKVQKKPSTETTTSKPKLLGLKASESDVEGLKASEIDYYVHYTDHDRRLDEWISLSKFDLATIQRAEIKEKDSEAPSTGSTDGDEKEDAKKPVTRRTRQANVNTGGEFRIGGGNWHGSSNAGGDPTLAALEREHEEATKVKNIEKIYMGPWEVEAWYYSPYPEEYSYEEKLFVCEFCLKYCKRKQNYLKHKQECSWRSPPGQEIYREGTPTCNLCVYEIDGKDHRVYCQNLCLLAKLFLDHKNLYYDVDPFNFYVITETDENGAHIVGYFSKEKQSAEDYNLACILTFPQFQKCGYGKFIISLSYELSKREGKPGSPEKPLSDLGKISYRSYWTHVLLTLLDEQKPEDNIQIKELCELTGIKAEDIISTLQSLDMIKVWKGQHVVYVRQDIISDFKKQKKRIRLCNSKYLSWIPHAQRKKIGASQK
ncbi:histone acetyltransferase MYST1 [Chaetoceros tenuissimus]|uniref:Histone acetyltransferase n=1 Tax=Chaetoceros tenuissimus TaxID=426638 RepID=A0AAD3CLY8_9STRA|nr:histone acetyltransferase MYST1 [Chaetoceros tenuissimus]